MLPAPLARPPVIAIVIYGVTTWALQASCCGDITLPKIFSDHMVLQRNSAVTIWGMAEPAQKLVITLADHKSTATADPSGHWSVLVETAAAGGPYELAVAAESGEPRVVFSDVFFGEVWLCSGQSNMEWSMKKILNSNSEIEQAKNYPNLRLFTVTHQSSPTPLQDFSKVESWRECSADSVQEFSAVAYFFGRELSRELAGIPIGLIDSSWGGTPAEAWISRPTLESQMALAPLLEHWDKINLPNNHVNPANLYNGMLAPLTRFRIRGAIWYQGEANNGRGEQYGTLLPALISDWRNTFSDAEMPFYFVQLAPFRYQDQPTNALPEIWDAQLKTLKSVAHTGMVVTTDIGETDNIHPKNKQEVGRRLAKIALADVYRLELPQEQQAAVSCSPIYKSHTVESNRIRLIFEHVGEGLGNRLPESPLTDFQICGEDRNFVPAIAEIQGNQVIVSSAKIENPIAVRFGWTDTSEPNLINSAGLPASPFRTDDFPLESMGRSF